MLVHVCGIPGSMESFTTSIPDEDLESWSRMRMKIFDELRKNIDEHTLTTYYCPLYLVNPEGAILDKSDLGQAPECVIMPRGSHADEFEVDIAASRALNDPVMNWSERKESFDKFGDFCNESRISLCNLNFRQIDPNIIECQVCRVAQRFDHVFLPIMMQHALANPSCANLSMWNGKTLTSPSMISRWAQEMVKQTVRNLTAHRFTNILQKRVRTAKINDHVPKRKYICSICLTNSAEVLYMPCLHLTTCTKCHLEKNNDTCQNCAQPITIATKVFN